MKAKDQVGHLSTLVHLLVCLDDHGDEDVSVSLSSSYHLLKSGIETEIAYVLFLTPALTVDVGYAGFNKLYTTHKQEQ